ncbi:MAG: transcriptional activator RfaH [Desulfobacterales bacterium]|nr:transcriptional activator RfaH [Desulfobacterales bacterium]
MNDRSWFAVQTKMNKEFLAKENYLRQGYIVYLPIIYKERRHARRVDKVVRPFFPRYLFLNLTESEKNWQTINSTIGVIGAVHFGKQYPSVPDFVIEQLKLRENENGFIDFSAKNFQSLKKGAKVELTIEGVDNLNAIFIENVGKNRAIILIEMLRTQVIATVPFDRIHIK